MTITKDSSSFRRTHRRGNQAESLPEGRLEWSKGQLSHAVAPRTKWQRIIWTSSVAENRTETRMTKDFRHSALDFLTDR
jgi:hypothetical protein